VFERFPADSVSCSLKEGLSSYSTSSNLRSLSLSVEAVADCLVEEILGPFFVSRWLSVASTILA
jgi:hypothetical protein